MSNNHPLCAFCIEETHGKGYGVNVKQKTLNNNFNNNNCIKNLTTRNINFRIACSVTKFHVVRLKGIVIVSYLVSCGTFTKTFNFTISPIIDSVQIAYRHGYCAKSFLGRINIWRK